MRSDDAASAPPNVLYGHFPAQESTLGEGATTLEVAIAEVRADVADLHIGLNQDFAALRDELAGLRRQTDEQFASARSKMLRRCEALRCDMIDLAVRLDRLLERRGA
ncbi:hypothetical protein [Nonomuraea helvata]|uniref:Biogenesis of lysosome-related organelles complex 1 subunit CNL1 n=1 Tax=Nonomuraea helvata TaxID=37484 RepID=A0ABV5RU62_9ACTN